MDATRIVTAPFVLQTHVITPTADAGGSISPTVPQTVDYGDGIAFTISPAAGYHIANVWVDGAVQGALTSYTFGNVTADHTIRATFGRYTLYMPLIHRHE